MPESLNTFKLHSVADALTIRYTHVKYRRSSALVNKLISCYRPNFESYEHINCVTQLTSLLI
jgi:hypothetical protein